MSAVSSNSNDREFEALRRAQRAHEPSMEEILASIRNIIADDREPSKSAPARSSAQRPAAAANEPQTGYSKDAAASNREEVFAPEPVAPKVVWSQAQPAVADATTADARPDEEPLLSPETDEAVASAFEALSANLAARSAEVADEMLREMLRPMLRAWLDENLPGIVERVVSAEIQRVARRPR